MTTVNAMSDANPSSFTGMMIGVLATIIITIVLVQVVGCGYIVNVMSGGHN